MVATDHFQKSQSQDDGLPELLLAYFCLNSHSEACAWLRRSTSTEITSDERMATNVCCNVEYLNFDVQNLRPSNVKVIFQRPSCDYRHTGGFGFVYE